MKSSPGALKDVQNQNSKKPNTLKRKPLVFNGNENVTPVTEDHNNNSDDLPRKSEQIKRARTNNTNARPLPDSKAIGVSTAASIVGRPSIDGAGGRQFSHAAPLRAIKSEAEQFISRELAPLEESTVSVRYKLLLSGFSSLKDRAANEKIGAEIEATITALNKKREQIIGDSQIYTLAGLQKNLLKSAKTKDHYNVLKEVAAIALNNSLKLIQLQFENMLKEFSLKYHNYRGKYALTYISFEQTREQLLEHGRMIKKTMKEVKALHDVFSEDKKRIKLTTEEIETIGKHFANSLDYPYLSPTQLEEARQKARDYAKKDGKDIHAYLSRVRTNNSETLAEVIADYITTIEITCPSFFNFENSKAIIQACIKNFVTQQGWKTVVTNEKDVEVLYLNVLKELPHYFYDLLPHPRLPETPLPASYCKEPLTPDKVSPGYWRRACSGSIPPTTPQSELQDRSFLSPRPHGTPLSPTTTKLSKACASALNSPSHATARHQDL